MQIQTNTDNTIEHNEALASHVESVVKESLNRFGDQLTRVEIHLSETRDHKSGGTHRCVMEARIAGHPPITITDHAAGLHQSIHGAVEKLKRSIDHTLGRISDSAKSSRIVAGADSEESKEQ